jgi:uncharacterized protein YndB with AHSA1/START domain
MTTTTEGRDLILTRTIDASREKVYRAWTDPALLKQWFAPLPWTTPSAELNVHPGGANVIVMRGPDGVEFPNRGIYLDVVPNQRLVFTDAYTSAWEPSEKPFMTVIPTFEDAGNGKTNYTARVRHWTTADREAHEHGLPQGVGDLHRSACGARRETLRQRGHFLARRYAAIICSISTTKMDDMHSTAQRSRARSMLRLIFSTSPR